MQLNAGTIFFMKTMTAHQQQFFAALPTSWKHPLENVCHQPAIDALVTFLKEREAAGATIYPAKRNIFAALRETPFDKVRVVIVGQDPYHGPKQAHGLSFSVQPGISLPPSLKNIFKELHADIGMPMSTRGTLTGWAHQGVLMLNAILTVEKGQPAAHANKGWEVFTDAILEEVIKRRVPTVFILWGAYAQKKVQHLHAHLDPSIHLILKSAHPSPYSATGFFGCKHFSKANAFLKEHHEKEIDWSAV